MYLYNLGVEKQYIYQYRDIRSNRIFKGCKRRKRIFNYNYNFSSIKTANDVMFITSDNNSNFFDLCIDDVFDKEEFYDVKLFAYSHDHDWRLVLYVDNELLIKYFVNYLNRKTEVILTNDLDNFN